MRITPTQTSFPPESPPVSFRVETGGFRYYSVQMATDGYLLNGSGAARRTPASFFESGHGDDLWPTTGRRPFQREVAGQHQEAPTGRVIYPLPRVAWGRLRGGTQRFYRLLVSADDRRRRLLAPVEDVDWRRAPSVSIARLPAQFVRHHDEYDALAIQELKGPPVSPTPANFLQYDDGVAP